MICFNLVFYRTAVTFFFTILTNSPFWCPFGSIFWFFSIIELTVSSSSSMSREAIRISKRPLETLIPWVTGWREFLQRAFKPLYIRPEAPNLFRLHNALGSSGQRPRRPKLYKKKPCTHSWYNYQKDKKLMLLVCRLKPALSAPGPFNSNSCINF